MNEYPQRLADAVEAVLAQWLVGCVMNTARRAGYPHSDQLLADARQMAQSAAPVVQREMNELLATDVDAQRSNPLSVLRNAVRYPTSVLRAAGVTPPQRGDFSVRSFPDDIYDLSPAAWADVDESLQEPGLIWGAWKAKTVLNRRHQRDAPQDQGE